MNVARPVSALRHDPATAADRPSDVLHTHLCRGRMVLNHNQVQDTMAFPTPRQSDDDAAIVHASAA